MYVYINNFKSIVIVSLYVVMWRKMGRDVKHGTTVCYGPQFFVCIYYGLITLRFANLYSVIIYIYLMNTFFFFCLHTLYPNLEKHTENNVNITIYF